MQQAMHSFTGLMPSSEFLAAVRRGDVSSICLFAYNLASPAQLRHMTETLQAAAHEGGHPPLLIGIDQEGGQLIALANGTTELPGNMALGATRSVDLATKAGQVLGRELLAMGVNMNFAPSLDVNIDPQNPVIGIRSFGNSPDWAGRLGIALMRGMKQEGVIATPKHFPGHGDTSADSHHQMPVVPHSVARLLEIELAPFRAAIEAGAEAIMTAHIMYPALDDTLPATLSHLILTDLLRHEMNFAGLIITDALDMYAVSQLGHRESVQAALQAGADLLMMGHIPEQMELMASMRDAVNPESVARIRAVRQNLPTSLPPLAVVGSAEHHAIAQEIADASITVVRDNGRIPLRLGADDQVAVITIAPMNLTPADTSSEVRMTLGRAIRKRHEHVLALEMPFKASAGAVEAILNAVENVDHVVVATIMADKDSAQANLVRVLQERGQSPIVVSMRTPYDITAFPMIETYLCAYSIRDVSSEAVAKVLFGEIEAHGVLPCAIPGISD
ncbi:MAG: beta-N-acetylhexosaminidase [Anaerolineaceae bacterium]|nr:beta-N-acetylhexosaminidase [Anaerolineaceae bacterium]